MRERAEGCPLCPPVSPAASGAAWPRDPLPCVPAPLALSHTPRPRGSPALAPAFPPHSPGSPAGPAAPGPVPRLPINSSVQRAGLGTATPGSPRLLPGLTPGRAGEPRGVAPQGTVPPKERSASPFRRDSPLRRLSPQAKRAFRRDVESTNQTFTPLQEMLPKENQSGAHVASKISVA